MPFPTTPTHPYLPWSCSGLGTLCQGASAGGECPIQSHKPLVAWVPEVTLDPRETNQGQAHSLRKAGPPSSIPVTGADLPPQKLAICLVVFTYRVGPSFLSCSACLLSHPVSLFSAYVYLVLFSCFSSHSFVHFSFALLIEPLIHRFLFWFLSYSGGPLPWGLLPSCPLWSWVILIPFLTHPLQSSSWLKLRSLGCFPWP